VLVGRDRQVLAVAEPRLDLISEIRLLALGDDGTLAALVVAAEHLVEDGPQQR
jgi:hypothetical protein